MRLSQIDDEIVRACFPRSLTPDEIPAELIVVEIAAKINLYFDS
jgi:hypothetical protein